MFKFKMKPIAACADNLEQTWSFGNTRDTNKYY